MYAFPPDGIDWLFMDPGNGGCSLQDEMRMGKCGEPEENKEIGLPSQGSYVRALSHWLWKLRVSKDEYVLEQYRLPDELGHLKRLGVRVSLHPGGGRNARVPELVHIPWGERSYLVEPSELVAFCNNVNNGQEPRQSVTGLFFLRDGDWEKEAKGLPRVPDEVKDYVLSRPIVAKIVNVMPFKKNVQIVGHAVLEDGYPVVIDRGKEDGLRLGMRLTRPGEFNTIIAFVTSVDDKQSTLLAWWLVTSKDKIDPGVVLSTRPDK
jgi:hypothetical protein